MALVIALAEARDQATAEPATNAAAPQYACNQILFTLWAPVGDRQHGQRKNLLHAQMESLPMSDPAISTAHLPLIYQPLIYQPLLDYQMRLPGPMPTNINAAHDGSTTKSTTSSPIVNSSRVDAYA